MNSPITQQTQVGDATLLRIEADVSQQCIRLYFDRDILLRSADVPIVITNGYTSSSEVNWARLGPAVLVGPSPLEMAPGTLVGCYVPEALSEIASAEGGRVLSALVWGSAM